MPANPISLKEMHDHIYGMIDKVVKDFQFTWPRAPQDYYLFYVPSTEKEWGELHLLGGTMEERLRSRERLFTDEGKKTYPVLIHPLSPAQPPHILFQTIYEQLKRMPIVPSGG